MIEILDKNITKIVTVFSLAPGIKLNRKIIKEKTSLSNIILDKTLSKLTNLKLLNKERSFFSLNFQNKEIKETVNKTSEHYTKLKQLPLKEYFMIMDIESEILKIKNIGDVYLFGSYSKLIFKENSDIDIAIISNNINRKELNNLVKKLEYKYNKNIEVHYFTKNFYNNKRDPLVKEIFQQGIKLV